MTAHELARLLLSGPDLRVVITDAEYGDDDEVTADNVCTRKEKLSHKHRPIEGSTVIGLNG